jgi:acyl-coenzyme A synthetase/AMP-(fatty) acid ligase
VRIDEDGFLYFIGRKDDMIKTSGYRVSPTEIEEVVYASGRVAEAAALGVPHPALGQAIVVVVKPNDRFDKAEILAHCKSELPNFMVPQDVVSREDLPRNPNGKIDRKLLLDELRDRYQEDPING